MDTPIPNREENIQKVFIWGASGHAHSVLEIASLCDGIEVVGLIDDIYPEKTGTMFHGLKVLGGKGVLPELKKQGVYGCIPGFGNCASRLVLGELLERNGFKLVSAIHPRASIATSAKIGAGVVIGPYAVVDSGCIIEDNCILNNCSCVSHGGIIGAGTHICPGVTIGGNVSIGGSTWIGIGATVIDNLKIGSRTYIGAGSVVTKSIPDDVLAYGVPARVIRSASSGF